MRPFRVTLSGLFVAAFIVAVPGLGQEQLSTKAELEGPFLKGRSQFLQLMMGTRTPSAADKELIDINAKWYIHRFTWRSVAEGPQELVKEYANFQAQFDRDLMNNLFNPNMDKKGNRALVEQLGPAMVRSIKPIFAADILPGDNRLVQVNAATLLPKMARLKQDDVSNYLVELVKDPAKHDAIRVFAVKGLRETFPVHFFEPELDKGDKNREKLRDREVPYVESLTGVVEGTVGAKERPADEDVIRFLRRQALESLTTVGIPAIVASKKEGTLQGAAAPTLLKVLSKKGLTPAPGIHEKIEAAVGLCQLRYVIPQDQRAIHEYRPELAVYLIGRFVEEYAREHNAQWAFLKPGLNHKPATVMWKVQSKRLELALADLVRNAAPSQLQIHRTEQAAVEKSAKLLEQRAREFLTDIYNGNQASPAKLVSFRTEVGKMRPKTATAFRSLKTPDIDLD